MANVEKKKMLTAADYFREMRESKNFTQEEVARFLGYKSKQIVSNWERGVCMPPLNKLYELAKILDLNHGEVVDVFLNETEALITQYLDKKRIKA